MILAFDSSSIDGSAHRHVADLAQDSPSWLDGPVSAWSTYGPGLFAVLMALGRWRARRESPRAAQARARGAGRRGRGVRGAALVHSTRRRISTPSATSPGSRGSHTVSSR